MPFGDLTDFRAFANSTTYTNMWHTNLGNEVVQDPPAARVVATHTVDADGIRVLADYVDAGIDNAWIRENEWLPFTEVVGDAATVLDTGIDVNGDAIVYTNSATNIQPDAANTWIYTMGAASNAANTYWVNIPAQDERDTAPEEASYEDICEVFAD